jgi:hypothetical protein
VSPILVRPVREQFEHDRVIRVLQARYKRKYEVIINPGAEQNASVSVGDLPMYPDLVLFEPERGKKLQATVEVETTESINTLEAMAEWGPFSRIRSAFFLYVPANSIDTVRRLCTEHGITPSEIWTYHAALDQIRFTMVQRAPENTRTTETKAPKVTINRAAPPAEMRPAAPVVTEPSGANGSEARAVPVVRTAPAKPKPPKKATPRIAKSAKKVAPKKTPRAAASRSRAAAKKNVRKSAPKRSVSPKR